MRKATINDIFLFSEFHEVSGPLKEVRAAFEGFSLARGVEVPEDFVHYVKSAGYHHEEGTIYSSAADVAPVIVEDPVAEEETWDISPDDILEAPAPRVIASQWTYPKPPSGTGDRLTFPEPYDGLFASLKRNAKAASKVHPKPFSDLLSLL